MVGGEDESAGGTILGDSFLAVRVRGVRPGQPRRRHRAGEAGSKVTRGQCGCHADP